jgi:tetratricopeptide (TPR) repeat protein
VRVRIEILRNMRPHEQVLFPPGDPRRVVQDFYLFQLDPNGKAADWYRITELYPGDQEDVFKSESANMVRYRSSLLRQSSTLAVARDVVISNLKMSVEGDDQLGYRIRVQAMNSAAETRLVAKRSSGYIIVASGTGVDQVGVEVLRRVGAGDLKGAKQWLDWTREEIKLSSGEDPLSGSAFPRFWNRGDDPDPARMKLAAYALLVESSAIRQYLPELNSLRAAADPAQAGKIDLLLVRAAIRLKDWQLYHATAPRLLAANPASDLALWYVTWASIRTQDWPLAEKALADRLQRIPDDLAALRYSMQLADGRGDFAQARKLTRPLIDSNRAEMYDINLYTWDSLFLHNTTTDDVTMLQHAITAKSNSGFAEIHTLACLYAEVGNTKEARDLLLRAMDAAGLEEPNEAIWLGLGRIAEQYGMSDVALALYAKVSKTPDALPASNYDLAQLRVATIRGQSGARSSPAVASK